VFENLSEKFQGVLKKLRGHGRITEGNIDGALNEVRLALLEADVNYKVVKDFVAEVRGKALGAEVLASLSPDQHFVKIVHDEMAKMMGSQAQDLNLARKPPVPVMLVGLQGSGKTTSCGKIALHLQKRKRSPYLVPADVYRPAAIEQLKVLARQLEIPCFDSRPDADPVDICREAVKYAELNGYDTVLLDTAGRLHIDAPLMEELARIKAAIDPADILLVADAMTGQDAVNVARSFHEKLGLTGVVLTKMDGDARGGAALSVKGVTGKPIVFAGMGEAMDKLEPFRPEGIATRILGFGDVVGLVQDFEKVVDEKKAEEDALKILKGEFTLYQFMDQIKSIQKMGSLKGTLEKLPFFHEMVPDGATVDEKSLGRIEAMIHSMTPDERNDPKIILAQGRNDTRARRIARGSGHKPQDVKDLVQRFETMREVMKQVGKNPALLGRLPGFRESIELAKSRGEDIGDFDPGRMDPRMMQPYGGGQRKMSNADKEKRRKKEKEARKARKKARR